MHLANLKTGRTVQDWVLAEDAFELAYDVRWQRAISKAVNQFSWTVRLQFAPMLEFQRSLCSAGDARPGQGLRQRIL